MSRVGGQASSSGYYHVMIRGINKESVFQSDDERRNVLELFVHRRVGPVFGDRYRSEAIEDDAYLLGALRYLRCLC